MNCHRIQNRILELPPSTLETDIPEDVRRHLENCPDCQQALNEHLKAIQTIRPSTQPAVPPEFKNNLMEKIRTDEIGKKGVTHSARYRNMRWKPAYVCAVALLILIGLAWFEPQAWLSFFWNAETALPADLRLVQAFASEFPNRPRSGVLYQSREIIFKPVEGFFGEEQQWYPIGAINANGDIECVKISFKGNFQEKRTVKDESWYDFDRGAFIRILSLDGETVYTNAFDDHEIVITDFLDSSEIRLNAFLLEPYALPQPEEFLNLASSLSALWMNSIDVKIVHSKTSRKYNGESIQQIKSTLHKTDDNYYRYYFNFTPDADRIFEINSYVNREPLLSIRPGINNESPSYPSDSTQFTLDAESAKKIKFERLNAEPYIRAIDINKLRESTWDGFLYANPDASHFPIARITDFFDFSYPLKRTIAIQYEAPGADPVLILQSISLNQRYGVKIEAISRPSRLTTEKTRVWEGSILDAAAKHITKALQPIAQTDSNHIRGYLLRHENESHEKGSYALIATGESPFNTKFETLVNNLSPIGNGN